MEIRDYYTVLGVTREANLRDIESAYQAVKEKARNDASITLEEAEKAFETLKDPHLKRKYDADLGEGKYVKYHPEAKPQQEEPQRFDFKRKKKPSVLANPTWSTGGRRHEARNG